MIFALAGNQNCGKTTLFNQLTGSNQLLPAPISMWAISPVLRWIRRRA